MAKQKFKRGDLVYVEKITCPSRDHFTNECRAIVIASYTDQYASGIDRDEEHDYTLHLEGRGESSWYPESGLTLIETKQHDLLEQWIEDKENEATIKGDIDWIFANKESFIKRSHSASIAVVASMIGIDNLWGSRGEGMTYYMNARMVLLHFMPFLEDDDQEGWVVYAGALKKRETI
jgi:hypothetical protein